MNTTGSSAWIVIINVWYSTFNALDRREYPPLLLYILLFSIFIFLGIRLPNLLWKFWKLHPCMWHYIFIVMIHLHRCMSPHESLSLLPCQLTPLLVQVFLTYCSLTILVLDQGGEPRVADFIHGSDGLGNIFLPQPKAKKIEKNAAEFLVDKVSEYPGEVSILALGPLTNVALVSCGILSFQFNSVIFMVWVLQCIPFWSHKCIFID